MLFAVIVSPLRLNAASIFFAASSEAAATSLRPLTISWNIVGSTSEASIWPQAGRGGDELGARAERLDERADERLLPGGRRPARRVYVGRKPIASNISAWVFLPVELLHQVDGEGAVRTCS